MARMQITLRAPAISIGFLAEMGAIVMHAARSVEITNPCLPGNRGFSGRPVELMLRWY
jgi:hypothetical protein